MKNFILLFIILLTLKTSAQITRYPYIQSTTQNSTIIAWKTSNGVLGIVKYGTDSSNLVFTVSESGANTNHALLLENLNENTKYYYEVYSALTLETSEYFHTAKDSTHNQFSFIHYGDCGYNSAVQHQIGDLMEADSAEFAVVCGDIDQGGVPHVSSSAGGDNYDDIYFDVYNDGVNSKMLSHECHFTSIGNHDYYANNGAEYDNSFYLPHNNNENSERYYSFTWGDAKFICLDVITPYDNTTFPINFAPLDQRWWTDFRQGTPQYNFLENELKCNDKKWVFVYFHEGPWTNYWGADYYIPVNTGGDYYHFDGNIMVRNHLVPLFEQYDVDFVLNGHSHLFERGEQNGVTYVTSGSAGDADVASETEVVSPHWPQLPLSILENVYAKFTVDNDTVHLDVINKDNNIVDVYDKTKIYIDFNINPSITNVSCFQGNDGSVTLNIVGPKAPYTIEWFNGDTVFSRNNLVAGTYYAYVRNKYDCEKVVSVVIEEPPILIPQIVSTTGNDQFCEGDTISLLTYDQFSYSKYNWSNGDTTAQIFITSEETISVTVENGLGCIGTSVPFSVSFLDNPVANYNFAFSGFTYNFLAGTINTISYSWDFDDGTDTTLTNSLIQHTFPTDGNYEVVLYASNDCATDIFTMNIKVGDGDSTIDIKNLLAIFDKENIDVFPNPFSTQTTIKVKNLKGLLSFNLYNIKGESVKTFKSRKKLLTLKRENLVKGIYFLTVIDKNGKGTISKFVVK